MPKRVLPLRRPSPALRIAEPCTESWHAMLGSAGSVGSQRERTCTTCQKRVLNIAAMTKKAAFALETRTDAPCIRLTLRSDGSVFTRASAAQRQHARAFLLAVAIAGSACRAPAEETARADAIEPALAHAKPAPAEPAHTEPAHVEAAHPEPAPAVTVPALDPIPCVSDAPAGAKAIAGRGGKRRIVRRPMLRSTGKVVVRAGSDDPPSRF